MRKTRWRLRHTEGRNLQRKRYYDKYRRAIKSQDRWKEWEEQLIMFQPFRDRILHGYLGRSIQAIQTKRCKILRAWRKESGNYVH